MNRTGLAALVSVVVCACGGDARSAEPASAPATVVDTAESSVITASRSEVSRRAAAKRITLPLSFHGVGPLFPGMSLARAIIETEGDFYQIDGTVACSYFRSGRAPHMQFVFLDRHLARIEVDSGAVASTAEGVKIGATEEQVEAAYPGRVTVSNDTYRGGHLLTVSAPEESDSALRIVFETDGKRVKRFRSGVRPAVGWVEGCS